jgi:hypothetical protein
MAGSCYPAPTARWRRTTNPHDVKSGKYALVYTYTVAQGKFNAIVRLEPESWAQGFRFWVKTDHPTMLVFVVSEEGGERWQVPSGVGITSGTDNAYPQRLHAYR